MPWQIEYYTDARGDEPIQDFIERLSPKQQAAVFTTFGLLERLGMRLGMPHARPLEDKVWELRIQVGGAAFRFLYIAHGRQQFVILHAFQKKQQKTPKRELDMAHARRKDWMERHKETS